MKWLKEKVRDWGRGYTDADLERVRDAWRARKQGSTFWVPLLHEPALKQVIEEEDRKDRGRST